MALIGAMKDRADIMACAALSALRHLSALIREGERGHCGPMILLRASPLQIALNDARSDAPALGEAIALNVEGCAPEWILLVPAGKEIHGNDRRKFLNPDPRAVVATFQASGMALPIDVNHAQFLRAPKGEDAPAAGWIEELQIRDGAIWGRVEWTPSGKAALDARSYRYISPALLTDKSGAVLALAGAGLVNRPNFNMPALNSEGSTMKNLLKKLGLAETASENDAIAAMDALQTQLNAAKTVTPSLAAYVPRADYDIALNAANEAKTELATHLNSARTAKVTALVDQAVKDGKVAPATKDFYMRLCATEQGVAEFEKFLAAQPSVFTASGLDNKPAEGQGGKVALNADERALLAMTNLTEEQFLASKALGPVRTMAAQ